MYCEKCYERFGKKFFWFIKHSGEVINKMKLRGFRATSLSTYDYSGRIAGRPKEAPLFWLFGDFRCDVLLLIIILVIYIK